MQSDKAKITAFVPRELWARTKAFVVFNKESVKSAQDVIVKALEEYLQRAEKTVKGGGKR